MRQLFQQAMLLSWRQYGKIEENRITSSINWYDAKQSLSMLKIDLLGANSNFWGEMQAAALVRTI